MRLPPGGPRLSVTDERQRVSGTAAIGIAFFAVVVLRSAWISDTAYYTLRTVEHAARGLGWGWNAGERVLAFDHPLWFLLLLAGRMVSGETYFVTIGMSIVASLLACALMVRRARTDLGVLLASMLPALSPTFVTFSTSGLESPLVHLLVALFAFVVIGTDATGWPRRAWVGALLGAAAAVTQPSTLVLTAPLLLLCFRTLTLRRQVVMWTMVAGPLVSWLTFAVWYYGVQGATSWRVLQGDALTWSQRLAAGLDFLGETARQDPLMTGVIVAGVLAGGVRGMSARRAAVGVLAYSGWLVASGGSQMAGYGLTVGFVVAMFLLIPTWEQMPAAVRMGTVAAVVAVVAGAPTRTFAADARYGMSFLRTARPHDARAADYQATGLLLTNRVRVVPAHEEAERARAAAPGRTLAIVAGRKPGFFGFAAGPEVHVIDPSGRGDALLALLPPMVGPARPWRPLRRIPEGYEQAATGHADRLAEASLARLYAELMMLTRAPLWQSGRFAAMVRLNSVSAAAVADSSYGPAKRPAAELGEVAPGQPCCTLGEGGLLVQISPPRTVAVLDMDLSATYDFTVTVMVGTTPAATATVDRQQWAKPGLITRRLTVPAIRQATGIVIRCGSGVGPCEVGRVTIGPDQR